MVGNWLNCPVWLMQESSASTLTTSFLWKRQSVLISGWKSVTTEARLCWLSKYLDIALFLALFFSPEKRGFLGDCLLCLGASPPSHDFAWSKERLWKSAVSRLI